MSDFTRHRRHVAVVAGAVALAGFMTASPAHAHRDKDAAFIGGMLGAVLLGTMLGAIARPSPPPDYIYVQPPPAYAPPYPPVPAYPAPVYTAPAYAPATAAQRLQELDQACRAGLLSPQECEAKRRQIIEGM